MAAKAANARVHSLYLDEFENAAVRRVADASRLSANAVIRALVRQGLGLGGELRVEIPEDVAEWAAAQQAARDAGKRLR